jgi:predicted metalloprotease
MTHPVRGEPARPWRVRIVAAAGGLVAGVAVLGAWVWAEARPAAPAAALAVPAARAEGIVRRTEVAFADAEGVWDRAVRAKRREYRRAELQFFSRAAGTPCAPAPVSGPFYCPEAGVAAFDLRFLDTLGERLKRERELGLSLYAARVAAMHLQRELGELDRAALALVGARRGRRAEVATALALQADCLAGVWAAAAEPRLGPVPEGFWDQLVWSARNVAEDLGREGIELPAELDVFAAGARPARGVAFAEGYAAGRIGDCRLALDG